MAWLRRDKDCIALVVAWALLLQAAILSFTSGVDAATLASGGSIVLCTAKGAVIGGSFRARTISRPTTNAAGCPAARPAAAAVPALFLSRFAFPCPRPLKQSPSPARPQARAQTGRLPPRNRVLPLSLTHIRTSRRSAWRPFARRARMHAFGAPNRFHLEARPTMALGYRFRRQHRGSKRRAERIEALRRVAPAGDGQPRTAISSSAKERSGRMRALPFRPPAQFFCTMQAPPAERSDAQSLAASSRLSEPIWTI